MDIHEARKAKKNCEKQIMKLIYAFQIATDLKVRKIHLNVNMEPSNNEEYINIILKGL